MPAIEQSSEVVSAESAEDGKTSSAESAPNIFQQPIPARPVRWMPQRKAEILAAVRRGSISLRQACDTYELSLEEFMTWQRGDALYGLAGLRATAAPQRRDNNAEAKKPLTFAPDLCPESE
jgi:hypothetical protein